GRKAATTARATSSSTRTALRARPRHGLPTRRRAVALAIRRATLTARRARMRAGVPQARKEVKRWPLNRPLIPDQSESDVSHECPGGAGNLTTVDGPPLEVIA